MKAIVLVGGEGTRLRPLTLSRPKQLLPIAGVPMLERVLSQLSAWGVDEAILSLGYRPDAFVAAYPGKSVAGVGLDFAVEPEPLDTGGAIRFAAEQAGISERFVVCNGDVLTDLDGGALIDLHESSNALATIALTPVDDPSSFGVVPTARSGRVIEFVEKPDPGKAPTNMVNAGIYVFEPEILDRIPSGVRVSVERVVFPSIVAEKRLFALGYDGFWIDAGTPGTFLAAQWHYLTAGTSPMPGARRLAGCVWSVDPVGIPGLAVTGELDAPGMGELDAPGAHGAVLLAAGVRVDPAASLSNVVVGPGSVIGRDVAVVDAVLLDGAVLEDGSRVERTIVGSGACVGVGATLVDSVIGDGAVVAAGSKMRGKRWPADPSDDGNAQDRRQACGRW